MTGNHNVSFGPSNVFVRLYCQPKSGLLGRQRIQVRSFFLSFYFRLFNSSCLIAHSKYADVFHLSWECSVIGYTLLLSLIEYKTLVMRGDLDKANEILPTIPKEQHNKYVISYFSLNFNIYIFNMYRNSSPTASYVLRDVIFRFPMVFVIQLTKNIVILVSLRCL